MYTLITLTATKEVTGHRVICNLCQRTRHTQRTARHRDVSSTGDIRHLVTAIDVRQNMTTTDVHIRVALYQAGRRQPLISAIALCIGKVTRATAKDVTIERMTVRTSSAGITISARLIMTIACIFIVWQPLFLGFAFINFSIIPCGTLSHGGCFRSNLLCRSRRRVNEVSLSVSGCQVLTETNLTTLYIDMRISQYSTVLTTAIDTTGNQRSVGDVFSFTLMTVRITVLDGDLGLVDVGHEFNILITCHSRIGHLTTTRSEDVTEVLRHRHGCRRCSTSACRSYVRIWTYIATADSDSRFTSTSSKGRRFTTKTFGMRSMFSRE